MRHSMKISSNFDSGNIEVLSSENINDIQLNIINDSNSEHFQWFHFRAQGVRDQDCTFRIMNASKASFAKGYESYQVVASYDREHWFRVPTEYNDKELIISHRPDYDSIFYAYFTPYSYERHLDLVQQVQSNGQCEMLDLGETVDGRDLNLIIAGNPKGKKIWIIARQHPGESMAEWYMEGLLKRLFNTDDLIAKNLLENAHLFIVPSMNPDGAFRGNLRSNAAGVNLNREWQSPSLAKSPEVFLVRQKIERVGIDLFMDIHGHETIHYNFAILNEGAPSYSEKQKQLADEFISRWMATNPDFQNTYGPEKKKAGEADLRIATNYIGETYGCLAMTIEMPFKDNDNHPNEKTGWSAERSMALGASSLTVINQMLEKL